MTYKCDWCCRPIGYGTVENGEHFRDDDELPDEMFCSEECLTGALEDAVENLKEERNLAYAYRTGRT